MAVGEGGKSDVEKQEERKAGAGRGGCGGDWSRLTIHKLYLPGQGYFSTVTT